MRSLAPRSNLDLTLFNVIVTLKPPSRPRALPSLLQTYLDTLKCLHVCESAKVEILASAGNMQFTANRMGQAAKRKYFKGIRSCLAGTGSYRRVTMTFQSIFMGISAYLANTWPYG